jgi:nucleotide-binding universal stress UspA family protein
MKALVGIDLSGRYEPALGLLRQLGFEGLEAKLLHCVEPVTPDGGFPDVGSTGPIAEIVGELERLGQQHLGEVAQTVQPWAPGVTTELVFGRAVPSMLRTAEAWGADLCVVGSERKSALGSFFLGSISKGLTLDSKVSVLVGKETPAHDGPLRCVLATDLSDVSRQALRHFVEFRPRGIGEASLVHAMEHGEVPEVAMQVLRGMAEELGPALGVEVAVQAVEGIANKVLHEAMASADLLVIGARGHGFLKSLVLGSVATHQVVKEAYNVLVVRPPA